MKWLLLIIVFIGGCSSAPKTFIDRCAKASYTVNAEYCGSTPDGGCDPTNMVLACDVVRF